MIDLSDMNTCEAIIFVVTLIVSWGIGIYVFWTEINRD